jgi:hypothetical protein
VAGTIFGMRQVPFQSFFGGGFFGHLILQVPILIDNHYFIVSKNRLLGDDPYYLAAAKSFLNFSLR